MALKFNLKRAVIGAASGAALSVPMSAVNTATSIWGVFNSWWYVPMLYTIGGAVIACDTSLIPEKENTRG